MTRLAVIAIVLYGCYSPNPQQGSPCASQADCPPALTCDHQMCVREGSQLDASMIDADLSCACTDGNTLTCAGVATPCTIGCASAHCEQLVPSNGLSIDSSGTIEITIAGLTTFDTDTGAIAGDLTRPSGPGVKAGIRYTQLAGIGVFTFDRLTVNSGVPVHFTGTRAVAFVVGTVATIHGELDVAATCYGTDPACPGPGGGAGEDFNGTAGGCGPGAHGVTDSTTQADSGGGGGAGFGDGGRGGDETISSTMTTFHGGAGGAGCITATLEPIVGGSGGGGGGPGAVAPTSGGGGGGAIQLVALESIVIDGEIDAGGGGGAAGLGDPVNDNGGAGGGGGAGGAILLEAPAVMISGLLVANGGGGGGAGDGGIDGTAGQRSQDSSTPAAGGGDALDSGHGGDGAAGSLDPQHASDEADDNTGGGGGGIGRIFIRGAAMLGGTISPPAGTDAIRVQ